MNMARFRTVGMGLGLVVLLLLAACGSSPKELSNKDARLLADRTMTVYYSSSCSCCKAYVDYLESRGIQVKARTRVRASLAWIKDKYGVSRNQQSCHTGVIGDYVVEGHVPLQSVAKMLRNKPEIRGITIPGMPRHAPGMGPPHGGTLRVQSIPKQGANPSVFSRVTY